MGGPVRCRHEPSSIAERPTVLADSYVRGCTVPSLRCASEETPAHRAFRVPEVILPPIARAERLGRLVRLAPLERLAEGVMAVEPHELAEVDVGHARVADDDDHVLVVRVDGGVA